MPQLFWSHAFLIASKGTTGRIGFLSAAWERFFEWKRIESEDEPRRVSLEVVLPEGRMLCNHPARHLIRILRQGEEALLGVEEMTDNQVVSSGEAPTKSGPTGRHRSSRHRLHQYGFVAMEISRRLLVTGCRTTQTAAGQRGASPTPAPPGG